MAADFKSTVSFSGLYASQPENFCLNFAAAFAAQNGSAFAGQTFSSGNMEEKVLWI